MERTKLSKQMYLLFALFLAYCFTVLLQFENVADILTAVILLTSFVTIFHSLIINAKRGEYAEGWFSKYRSAWLILSISLLWWALVDILWAFFAIIPVRDPEDMDLFLYLYTVPNILMAIAAVVFLINQRKRWNFLILLLDASVTAIISVGVIWLLFFRTIEPSIGLFDPVIISTSIYIISDAIVITCIFIWLLSIRVRKAPMAGHLIAAAVLVYTITDLFYGYTLFENLYVPNTLIDVMYMVYVVLITLGISVSSKQRIQALPAVDPVENLKTNRKVLFLLLIPFALMLLIGFEIEVILFLNSIILIHQFISAVLLNRSRQEAVRLAEDTYRRQLEQTVSEKTAELVSNNLKLSKLAREDIVTSLDNRRHFISELDHAIEQIRSGLLTEQIILFYMDIDNFRSVNDIYGHEAGDMLLQAVSLRLKEHLPSNGILARLGGDEFVMSFCADDNFSGIEPLAKRLIASFREPIYTGGYVFHTSLSIGITIYPQDGKDRTELLKNADLSMFYAKDQAQGSYIFFHDIPKNLIHRKNEIALHLRSADYDKEFELHYQPHVRASDGVLIGAEALLRWHNPILGNVSPAEFIPIAESIGEIVKIGNWVTLEAMKQIKRWKDQYGSDIVVGINVSPIQLDQEGFLKNLAKLLKVTGANPQQIDLEITENSAVNREERLVEIFKQINDIGCSISIDDFGTGYSSLSYLKRFCIHRVKIAKPLIDNIAADEDDLEIVAAIIAMARALKLRTIAEGVEEAAQLHKLRELDCDEIQGYYFSKPLAVRDFERIYLTDSSEIYEASHNIGDNDESYSLVK